MRSYSYNTLPTASLVNYAGCGNSVWMPSGGGRRKRI